ncbi:hypothetical protein BDN72DRAFT_906159 [Pluteus cervinus]|uniref:Uncharacterized protein n=1 Tax=Pluteus cervinus TaxID=181527 RepID=A0ACD3A051_9AGAR|nr:hypothetical protein BDN72DRAFT_906159 [Pluteus cervinus]
MSPTLRTRRQRLRQPHIQQVLGRSSPIFRVSMAMRRNIRATLPSKIVLRLHLPQRPLAGPQQFVQMFSVSVRSSLPLTEPRTTPQVPLIPEGPLPWSRPVEPQPNFATETRYQDVPFPFQPEPRVQRLNFDGYSPGSSRSESLSTTPALSPTQMSIWTDDDDRMCVDGDDDLVTTDFMMVDTWDLVHI